MSAHEIRQGHVLNRLRELPSASVHCVVTSPPYAGARAIVAERSTRMVLAWTLPLLADGVYLYTPSEVRAWLREHVSPLIPA